MDKIGESSCNKKSSGDNITYGHCCDCNNTIALTINGKPVNFRDPIYGSPVCSMCMGL